MEKNLNDRGYALTWVLITVVIISILVFAVQSMMLGYHNRTFDNMDEKQAYFTARSACEAISYAMENSLNSEEASYKKMHRDLVSISENEGELILDNLEILGDDSKNRIMGEIVTAKIIRHKNEQEGATTIYNYTIEVKAKKNELERILTKKMQRRETPVLDIGFEGFNVECMDFAGKVNLLFNNIALNVKNYFELPNQPVHIDIENGSLFLGKDFLNNSYLNKLSIEVDKDTVESDYKNSYAYINFSNGGGNSYIKLNDIEYDKKNSWIPLSYKTISDEVPKWVEGAKAPKVLPISKPILGGEYYYISGNFDIENYDVQASAMNPVYLVVQGNASIYDIELNDQGQPIVYIIVPSGKTLYLKGSHQAYNKIYSVIYGKEDSSIYFEQNVKFIGHLSAEWVSFWDQSQNEGPIIMSPGTFKESDDDDDGNDDYNNGDDSENASNGKPLNGWVHGLYN